jgi:hypothetical protein
MRTRRSPKNQDRLWKELGKENAPYAPCEWEENSDGQYEADCGNIFEVIEGTPEENGFKFCTFCGKPLKQVRFEEEDLCSE